MCSNVILKTALKSQSLQKYFALCETCFWCSSLLKIRHLECPTCKSDKTISLIPLSEDESYLVSLNLKSGLDISFSISRAQ